MKNIWWGQTFSLQAHQNILFWKHNWFDAALSYLFPRSCNVEKVMFQHLIFFILFSFLWLFFFFVVFPFPIFSLFLLFIYFILFFHLLCLFSINLCALLFCLLVYKNNNNREKNYKILIFIKYLIDRISNILLKKSFHI